MEERKAEKLRKAGSATEPLDGLRAVVSLRSDLEAAEAAHVRAALREGRSWSRIAQALGISKQAAHKRHADRARETTPLDVGADHQLRVTGEVRRVVELARDEARRLGSPEAGSEHLLLGLLRDDHGPALEALESAGVDLCQARRAVAGSTGERPPRVRARVQVARTGQEALEQAIREAMQTRSGHVGVEHLLAAILRDEEGPAARALLQLGVDPAGLSPHDPQPAATPGVS